MAVQSCVERNKIIRHNTSTTIDRPSIEGKEFQGVVDLNAIGVKKFAVVIPTDDIARVFVSILIRLLNRLGSVVSIAITFLVVMMGWVIFKIEDDMGQVELYFERLFDFSWDNTFITLPNFWPLLLVAAFFSFLPALSIGKKMQDFVYNRNTYSLTANGLFLFMSIILFVLSASSVTSSGFNPFIYFRF